jgi:hypothetical protein
MKAFIVDRYGRGSGRLGEMPEPELREDDVLVQVHAAGVNPLDSKIRNGEFKLLLPYRLPLILGNKAAGVVLRVGSRVQRFAGDEVYARPDKIGSAPLLNSLPQRSRCGAFAEDAEAWKKRPRSPWSLMPGKHSARAELGREKVLIHAAQCWNDRHPTFKHRARWSRRLRQSQRRRRRAWARMSWSTTRR